MKNDYSMQGLSQILEESDREDFQNARHLLAKLNNQQLINQYVNFNAVFTTFRSKHQLLLAVPINPLYKKFPYQDLQRRELAKRQLSQSMRQFELAQKAVLSKQQLGIKVNKKLQEQSERQRLQKSLYEKRHMYFEMLKTSRSFQSEYVHKDSFSKDERTFRSQPVSYKKDQKSEYKKQSQRKKLDAFVEQTIDDVFLRLQVFGEERDKIKKSWYSWGETCKTADRNKLISEWHKVHQQMKEVLQQLLEKLLAKVSSSELLRQLKIQNISILKSAGKKSTVDKSLRSTRVGNALSKEQTKMIVSFSQWYNKLLLDRRELDFIHVQYR